MNLPSRFASRAENAPHASQAASPSYSLADRVQGWLRMRAPREQRLRLVETLALGPRRSVAMIECDGQRFLAGLGSDGVTTIVPVTGTSANYNQDGVA